MSNVGYATLTVLPSARGFASALAGEINTPMANAGRDGGQRSGGAFAGAFKGLVGPAMGLAAGAAIGTFVVDAIKGAGELEQSVGAIETVFKGSSGQMLAWADSAANSVGLTKNEFNELGTLIGSQLKNGGTAMDELAPKTNQLIGLGADLSSMFGGSTSEAVQALSSALKGERDPIERYGVSLTQAAIDAKAAELGFKKVGGTLSQEANQAATLALIMEQTNDAHGNFAKESGTMAGQQQRLAAGWANLQTSIGTMFLPILTEAMSFINTSVMPGLQAFASGIGSGGLAGAFGPLAAAVGPSLSAIGGALSGVIPIVTGFVASVMPSIVTVFNTIVSSIGPVVSTISGVLVPVFNSLMPVVATVFGVISGLVRSAMQIIQGVIQVVTGAITGNWSGVWSGIQNIAAGVWSGITGLIGGAIRIVQSLISGVLGSISAIWGAVWNSLSNILRGAWNGIVSGVAGGISGVMGWIGSLGGRIMGAVGNFPGLLVGVGSDLIAGLARGIMGAAGMIRDAVARAIGNVVDFAKSLLGIHSPSRVFMEIGHFTAEGMAIGITKGAGMVQDAAKDLVPSLPAFRSPEVAGGGLQGALATVAERATGSGQAPIHQENHFNVPMSEEAYAELAARKLLRAGVGR